MTVHLNAKEFMFLAALSGASELPGIPDGYAGMEDAEIKKEMLRMRDALEERGYAELDFDGDFTPDARVRKLVDICAFCEQYVSVNISIAGEKPDIQIFYFRGGEMVKAEQDGRAYTLEQLSPDQVRPIVMNGVRWTDSQQLSAERIMIPNAVLQQVKDRASEEFDNSAGLETLKKHGCNDAEAEVIFSGLCERTNCFSVIGADQTGGENRIAAVMAINSPRGSFEVNATEYEPEENEVDAVIFQPIHFAAFQTKLDALLQRIVPVNTGGDFV